MASTSTSTNTAATKFTAHLEQLRPSDLSQSLDLPLSDDADGLPYAEGAVWPLGGPAAEADFSYEMLTQFLAYKCV